jgi:hypothetical protein
MSEEQKDAVDNLIKRADCAIKEAEKASALYKKLIWTFSVTIVIAISTLAGLGWQVAHQVKDIEYIRINAFNKDAAMNINETYKATIEGITSLIEDTDKREVLTQFNAKTDIILNRIMQTQSEIVPRGATNNGM